MNWKELDSGCEGIYYWVLEDEIPSVYPYSDVSVNLISTLNNSLEQFDNAGIEKNLESIDKYYAKAIDCIKAELRTNPGQFKLSGQDIEKFKEAAKTNKYIKVPDNDVEKYIHYPGTSFPVNQPNIAFYPDGSWLIRFAEADFPAVNYGHGIALFFDKSGEITSFEILEEE